MPPISSLPPSSPAGEYDKSEVLIYGMNYAPEMIGVGRYTGEIGGHLAAQGHAVTVITTPPHYPGWHVPKSHKGQGYSSEKVGKVSVLRCPILLRKNMRGIWRLLAPLSFAITSMPLALWHIFFHRPTLVLCVEPTLFVAPAALLGKLVGSRVVLHVQDLEIDAAFAVGHLKGGMVLNLAGKIETWILRRFDGLITISVQMKKRLVTKGVQPERIDIVRNWVDLSKIKPLEGGNGFRKELGLGDDDFIVLYAGNVGAKQALHIVLDAARMLLENPKIHFVIAGDGPVKASLQQRYGDLPNVHFLPLQPEERLCELLNLANLHVLPQSQGTADLVLPSKLGGMLASGKQLLVTADAGTELHDVLLGTALLVPAGDSKGMADAIRKLAEGEDLPNLGDGRKLAQLFGRDICLSRFYQYFIGDEEYLAGEPSMRKI
nr:WcaI family glycosyltransferase [Beijerinckia mobilis]